MAEYSDPKFVKWILEGDVKESSKLVGTAQQFLNTIRMMNKGGLNTPIIRRTLANGSEITARTNLPGVDIVTIKAKQEGEKGKIVIPIEELYIMGINCPVNSYLPTNPSLSHYFVARYTPEGDEVWSVDIANGTVSNVFTQVLADENYVYAGFNIRAKSDGSSINSLVINTDDYKLQDIAQDSGHLYYCGQLSNDTADYWWIRKVKKSDLSTVWEINQLVTNTPFDNGKASDIFVDDTGVYIGGTYVEEPPGQYRWRFEKRDKSNGNLLWSNEYTGTTGVVAEGMWDVVVDINYVYISTVDRDNTVRIRKYSKDGDLQWISPAFLYLGYELASFSDSVLYVSSFNTCGYFKINKDDGSLIETIALEEASDLNQCVAHSNTGTYFGGFRLVGVVETWYGIYKWRLDKRNYDDTLAWQVLGDAGINQTRNTLYSIYVYEQEIEQEVI